MNKNCYKNFRSFLLASLAALSITLPGPALAEAEWISVTLDNDTFVGNDNGYTNGIFISWFDGPEGNNKAEPGFLARAMLWSLPEDGHAGTAFDIGTIGQTMITPDDIEQDPPVLPPDDLPYAGLLFYADTYVQIHDTFADMVAVTIGVVGEYSFAEEAQETVHDIVGADEPCCWDTQLNDEIVFQFSRGRFWKTWEADDKNADFLLGADVELGTISSGAGVAAMVRYGRDLKRSYATALLVNSRTTNPIATQNGWYVFGGARAGYVANNIFLDGNTWDNDDQESIDYDEEILGVSVGLAYSRKNWSLTFAMNDLNVNETSGNDAADEYTEFGTFTFAWKLD